MTRSLESPPISRSLVAWCVAMVSCSPAISAPKPLRAPPPLPAEMVRAPSEPVAVPEPEPMVETTPPGEVLLSDEGSRQVIARFERGDCSVDDEGGKMSLEIRVEGQLLDTFNFRTASEPTACLHPELGIGLGDYNFDGHEDLAVPMDNSGPYSGPTYTILLYQPLNGHYQEAPRLSELTQNYLGLFQVDAKRQLLVASGKSGCCLHFEDDISVAGDEPGVVGSVVESVVFENDRCHVLTERSGTKGKQVLKRRCTKDESP
jgi:hypothetical protein